jgi:hypothetical protein
MIVGAGAFWWVPDNRYVLSAALVLVQLAIWWVANDSDNGVPWNLDRPLFTSTDPIWSKAVIFAALYGPLSLAAAQLWKARR